MWEVWASGSVGSVGPMRGRHYSHRAMHPAKVRCAHVLEYVSPEIAAFFIEKKTGTKAGRPRNIKSSIGNLKITKKQADLLQVNSHSQICPHLEKCCLLLSANESYKNAEQDIVTLTGMAVGHSTQQRLVQRQEFELLQEIEKIEEMSIDGGKFRLRTPCRSTL